MRKLLVIGLALALLGGCKKKTTKVAQGPAPSEQAPVAQNGAAPGGQVPMHAPTGVVLGGGGGGGGGAVQAVRTAVKRSVSENDLKNLHLFIENASAASATMPSPQQITAEMQREAPQLVKKIQNGDIVLTGTRTREGIWAYTKEPQSVAGEHLILTSSGIERMPATTLRQRLQQQGQ
jgi:hypothetical protein